MSVAGQAAAIVAGLLQERHCEEERRSHLFGRPVVEIASLRSQ